MRATDKATPFAAGAAAGTSSDFTLSGGEYLPGPRRDRLGRHRHPERQVRRRQLRQGHAQGDGHHRARHADLRDLAPGTYQLVIATLTAITATITRIPSD